MTFSIAKGWSEGEMKMQKLLHVPDLDNPTSSTLTPQALSTLQRAPLLAIGMLDDQNRPWTALWGGAPGFSEHIGGDFLGIRTFVDGMYDPVVQSIITDPLSKTVELEDQRKMFSALAINLIARKRVKLGGKLVHATVREIETRGDVEKPPVYAPKTQQLINLVTKIEESLGNCPKYLNQYDLRPAMTTPSLKSQGPNLTTEGRNLIEKADMFFLSTATNIDMDTNHRGGPPGFVRIISPTTIVFPEYSGNRYYQSLGNAYTNPLIGVTFPQYETGDVLYMTGTVEILVGADAAHVVPGTNLAVKIELTDTFFVAQGLSFRGNKRPDGESPYNPLLRTLAVEGNIRSTFPSATSPQTAKLVKKTILTPTIARLTFSVTDGLSYKPGQWIALSLYEQLNTGYRHMNNSDPQSLNDDFVRTFTISSTPSSVSTTEDSERRLDKEFEITIRSLGTATAFLYQQNPGTGLTLPILGVGGDFTIDQGGGDIKSESDNSIEVVPFIAAGIGITPVLGQTPHLDLQPDKFKLLWTIRVADINLVVDTLRHYDGLAAVTTVFLTGSLEGEVQDVIDGIAQLGASVKTRRLEQSDTETVGAKKWYLCAGKDLQQQIEGWLTGKVIVTEDFTF
ncbi:oxidoreductase-like protein [Boeremia exigua]|uniref:oxidoreductase-like protein n=1 Tax=Boeremia exigua TaxID=749465 RepID=UPI001E8DBFF7|nr:oxidoreductase-like protein [Boeremia exigua]KAH6638465.1 oxidoreductase-like protein [Boeremia exigua]